MFGSVYTNKKVLVTGATGFKGSWLCMWLLELGADVYGFSIDIPTQPSHFEVLDLDQRIQHRFGDITDKGAFEAFYSEVQPDFLFHLAAQPIVSISYADPLGTFATNVLGSAQVLDAVRTTDRPCTVVMITSDKCYENVEWEWGYRETDALGGKDPYSASKGAAELVIHAYVSSFFAKSERILVSSARAGNVIGGGDWAKDRLVPDAMRAWSQGQDVPIRAPKSTRPWQHVLEPLSGYLQLGERLHAQRIHSGEAYNFGPAPSSTHTVLELLDGLRRSWDRNEESSAPVNVGESHFHEAGLLKLNCDKALAQLQWQPVLDFSETVRFTATWYRQYYEGNKADDLTRADILQYTERAKQKGLTWTQT